MNDPTHPLFDLLQRDDRYRFDAYVFVFEALRYSQEVLGLGTEEPPEKESSEKESAEDEAEAAEDKIDKKLGEELAEEHDEKLDEEQRHVTGQELCGAIRLYALEQYGYMAKSVLNHWGIRKTGDFGEIVFNLIEIEQMRKTPEDRREDFEDVFCFDEGFCESFEITLPD